MAGAARRADLSSPWAEWLALLAGASVSLLGLAVVAGWHLHSSALLRVIPGGAPMSYNSALAFLLAGLSLLTLCLERKRWSVPPAAGVLGLGLLTALEYTLGLDLGIDELFFAAGFTDGFSHPGRMAPNSAACFSLSGAALILFLSLKGRRG